jgi:Bromodomain
VLKENGQWEPLTTEEMAEFERSNPEIARYWQDPNSLLQLESQIQGVEQNAPVCESWDLAAKRLISKLWRAPNAWIFHEPVDAEKLEIPDYFEVITRPMDLGTIRAKLTANQYREGMSEFVEEVNLTFENCLKYNGEDSSVGKMCKQVREEFYRLYAQLNMDFYLQ